jgi:hypothetical protein
MTDEHCWVKLNHHGNAQYRRLWKLAPNEWSAANLGMLAEGYTQNSGWHIFDRAYSPPIATLPRTMGRDEAMTAAKLILLTLKQMENQP